MKRKLSMLLFLTLTIFILASCNLGIEDDDVVETDEGEEETFLIPSHKISEAEYQMILPFRPSEARGAITNQVFNRVDIEELEDGLRRHSTDVFDPKDYVYEEGQYFTSSEIYALVDELNPKIKEKKKEKDQIKEYRDNPRVFSHILEQNYLVRKDKSVELGGISIGISLKSVYRFTTETGGPQYYEDISMKEMLEEGERVAEHVLKIIREKEDLKDVPVMIGLYREAKQASPTSGQYVRKTFVDAGESSIDKWEKIEEEHVLYTSKTSSDKHADDYQKVKTFDQRVNEYFPNYVGVVGEGFYVDDDLQKITLTLPLEFNGRSEVVGFTQYVYGVADEIFQKHYDLEIVIETMDKTEAIITRDAGDEELDVHILK